MIDSSVRAYLQEHREQHLQKLFELLRIPSIANNDDDGCDLAASWIAEMLAGVGLETRVLPTGGKPVVLASYVASDSAPTLLIYGHYDVQPPDPLDLWDSPPFSPEGYVVPPPAEGH